MSVGPGGRARVIAMESAKEHSSIQAACITQKGENRWPIMSEESLAGVF